jgi:hypothetical protein
MRKLTTVPFGCCVPAAGTWDSTSVISSSTASHRVAYS